MNREKIFVAACGLAAAAISAATVDHVRTHSALSDARRQAASARQRADQAEARPPKIVTKTVTKTVDKPVFGRSTLLGAYATGVISGGVYSDSGAMTYTANDTTCSAEYASVSGASNGATVNRDAFMKACLTNIQDTAKTDTTP